MNSYADVATFKSAEYAGIVSNSEQGRFRKLLENASRHIDRQTHRNFFCWEGAKYYDGKGGNLRVDDLLSIDTLKLDEDADGVYESTMAVTDYLLYEPNRYPKTRLELSNNSDYGGFASGVLMGVEITGVHGYGESATPYYLSSQTVIDAPLLAASTVLTVTSTTTLGAGMTLRIGLEQLYIEDIINATTCDVVRAVNGTSVPAVDHPAATPISIYEAPQPIIQATLMMAMRAWKRKDSAFQDAVGSPDTGLVVVYKDEDPYVKGVIHDYFRRL